MHNSLAKYRIGLGIIGLFTLAILVIVLLQSSATRADQQTENTANSIATKLNDYIDSGYAGTAPRSLAQAGIANVPSTISYLRTSNYSYYFCAKYQATNISFSSSDVAQNIVARGFGGGTGAGGINNQNAYNGLSDLEINPEHHKGWNCQTVELYNYNSNSTNSTYNSQ
jgi:type II secretory pathway pseudopilin PulG